MEILETKGRKMNKIKREEREDLHTFSDTTEKNKRSGRHELPLLRKTNVRGETNNHF